MKLASRVERQYREELIEQAPAQAKVFVSSQGRAGGGAAFSVAPTNRESTLPSHFFRVILLRRLQPLPLCACWCRCGRLLNVCGHHCAAFWQAGVFSRRRFALESIMARICREAQRDGHFPQLDVQDGKRLEVVVDGLPLRGRGGYERVQLYPFMTFCLVLGPFTFNAKKSKRNW